MKDKFSKFINLQGKYLTSLLILLALSLGQMWAADVTLFTANFSDAVWSSHATICAGSTAEETIEGILFRSNDNSKNYSVADGALTFCNNNIGDKYYFLIHLEDVNGSVNVKFGTVSNSQRISYKWFEQTTRPTSASSATATAASINTNKEISLDYTMTGTGTDLWLMVGRQGSGQATVIKTITITTPGASCAAGDPGDISKGSWDGSKLTLTSAGSPASGDTWYWQSAADGTDKTGTSGATKNVTEAGTYYIRSYNTAGDCWSDAKSIVVAAIDLTANYTVVYKDGETELGSEVIAVGSKPTATGISTTKAHHTFESWQLSGSDIALDAASWTSVAADAEVTLTARWTEDPKAVVTFQVDGATYGTPQNVYVGEKVAAVDAPTKANNVFKGWYNSSTKFDFTTAIASTDAITLDASWDAADANHYLYAYNDDFHFDGETYHTPEGKVDNKDGGSNKAITTPYTLFSGAEGITSIIATAAIYDSKNNWVNSYLKINTGGTSKLEFTIASGYSAVLKMKMGGYSANPTVTLKDGSNNTIAPKSGTIGGVASTENNYNEITYDLAAGTFTMTTATKTLYISHIDLEATPMLADVTLSDLQLDGATITGFSASNENYTHHVAYKGSIPTVSATANDASNVDVVVTQASAPLPSNATVVVTSKSDATINKTYTITMVQDPKDGVEIIKAVTANSTVTGSIGGTRSTNLSDGENKKLDKNKYFGMTLASGNFQAGDVLKINITNADNNGGKCFVYAANDGSDLVYEAPAIFGTTGVYEIVLPAAVDGKNSLYLWRENGDTQWNPYFSYMAVSRAIYPTLTAITINGRAGVVDPLDDHHFTVNIPNDANLASLTIVPTIIRNAPHATTPEQVTTNGGDWVLTADGDNTYRIMDKDGDYDDYTITLIRDVKKYTVTFNTDGGNTIAPVEVVANGYLAAGDVPADPTKEDYLFQGWKLNGLSVADLTSVQITQDTIFVATWAPDGAIKLIEAGALNTTDFLCGATLADDPVEIESVNYDYALLGGTASSPSGVNQLNKFIAYNATTTQTKVMVNVYNTATSARQVLIKGVVEGSTSIVDLATIDLDNGANKHVKSAYYEFNNAANRTIYISVPSSVNTVDFLQVKVIESGEPLKMFGESGYSINLNEGRLFGPSNTDLPFEGFTYNLGSGYAVLNSTAAVFKKNTSYQLDVPANVTMTLTTSAAKYYVSQADDGTDNETTTSGAHDFELTAGTWYINVANANLNVTNIAFSLPKCEAPVFKNTLADIELCTGEAIPAIDGTATVSDGGDVTYKWYQEGSETVLATTATYTPVADGSYFVVATNSLAGHQDVSTTSVVVKVAHFASVAITTAPEDVYKHAGLDAELSVVAEGKNVEYEWFTCDDELGTNPVAFDPAETGASLNLTAIETGIKYYQVVVTDECGTSASAVAKVEGFNDIALVDVTGDMSWDFSKASDGTTATSSMCNEAVLVNVPGIVNNSDFESDNIMATANKFSNGKLQASMIKFHTTVSGVIKVIFSNTGNKTSERYLVVNGKKTTFGSKDQTALTYYGFVPAGDVVLTVVEGDGNMFNFTSVKFTKKSAPDRVRDDSWMAPGELGTICYPEGLVAVGANMYQMAGTDEYGKFVFDEVEVLEPGVPYLFEATANAIQFYATDATPAEAGTSHGMVGTFTDITIPRTTPNTYYFSGTKFYAVSARATDLLVPANRAYVDLTTPQPAAAPVPGRRRISFGVEGETVATALDNLNAGDKPVKVMIDGQLFILRGEQMFDATGRLVK